MPVTYFEICNESGPFASWIWYLVVLLSDARLRNTHLEYTQIYIIVLILDVGDDRLYVFKNEIDGSF